MSRSRRFTIVIADRRTGAYRRFGIRPLPALTALLLVFVLPMLIGMGLRWSARAEIEALQTTAQRLDLENRNFRAATGELTTQVQSLQAVVGELGAKAAIDSDTAQAMDRLPAVVKSRAAGGPIVSLPSARTLFSPRVAGSSEDTFGVLRDLLYTLESRLQVVQPGVERRQALAAATPSIWPARGWLNDGFGGRRDPFTGGAGLSSRASTSPPSAAIRCWRRPTARSAPRSVRAPTAT